MAQLVGDMPYKVIRDFENAVARWSGAKYGVAVESCTAAIFLSLEYSKTIYGSLGKIEIPKNTYPGVPCSIIHVGGRVKFTDETWKGIYELRPYKIYDSALCFKKNMYRGGLHCLSFHIKKHLPIGRGGMILTDSHIAQDWLRKARFDGRCEMPLKDDNFTMLGWNMYMTPDQAARGLELFNAIKDKDLENLRVEDQGYPDLSRFEIYAKR